MAKKSKIFNEIRSLQNQEPSEKKTLKNLEKKIRNSPIGEQFPTLVPNPKGEVKMSEVLEDFAEPYLEFAHTLHQREEWLSIAVVGWNLAIQPEDKRKPMLDSFLALVLKESGFQAAQETRELLAELVERKQTYFADNQRTIVEFQVQDVGNHFSLSVASTLPEKKASQ